MSGAGIGFRVYVYSGAVTDPVTAAVFFFSAGRFFSRKAGMSRGDQLSRQWKIIQALIAASGGRTAAELAAGLGCSVRTVYRDLEALQSAGFPLYTEMAPGRCCWAVLEPCRQSMPLPCSLPELMALCFSRTMLQPLRNTIFAESLDSLFEKITAMLPPESLRFLQTVQETIAVGTKQYKDYSAHHDHIARIYEGALSRHRLRLIYCGLNRGQPTSRTIDPYRIWFVNDTFYLIGYCHLRRSVRVFAVERIRDVAVTDETFSMPEGTHADMPGSGFGVVNGRPEPVRIQFDRNVAPYIREKVWHPGQRLSECDDGGVVFEAELALTRELQQWVQSWGVAARVLSPGSLRERIRREAIAVLAHYDGSADTAG